jgi:hypothetical protein
MNKKLQAVLYLGQMATTPANKQGVHFIAKAVEFGKRKEIVVSCPKDGVDLYTIPLEGQLRNELRNAFKNSVGELFLLIERKGEFGSEVWKLKDYSDHPTWQNNTSYVPKLDSVVISLTQSPVGIESI